MHVIRQGDVLSALFLPRLVITVHIACCQSTECRVVQEQVQCVQSMLFVATVLALQSQDRALGTGVPAVRVYELLVVHEPACRVSYIVCACTWFTSAYQ